MADGRQIISTGETPTAAKLNKIARRVVIDCTSGTHPSSPAAQTHIFETDTELLKVYDGTAYQTYPNGVIAWDTIVGTSFGTSPSAITGSGTSFVSVVGQWYEYRCDLVLLGAASNMTINVEIERRVGGGSYTGVDALRSVTCLTAGWGYNASVSHMWEADTAATIGMRVTCATVSGSGSCANDTTARLAHMGLRV